MKQLNDSNKGLPFEEYNVWHAHVKRFVMCSTGQLPHTLTRAYL